MQNRSKEEPRRVSAGQVERQQHLETQRWLPALARGSFLDQEKHHLHTTGASKAPLTKQFMAIFLRTTIPQFQKR